jgi:hypothetical protein
MAWLSSLFQDGCDYVRVTGAVVQELANSDAPWIEAGFDAYREPRFDPSSQEWKVQYTGTCLEYPKDPIDFTADTFWQVAKFLDFAAVVLGGAGAFFLWFSTACVFSPGTWRWSGYQVFVASALQTSSFLWFLNELCQFSDDDSIDAKCELFWGSKMDCVAAVLWLVTALLILCHYPHPEQENDWIDEEGAHDEAYEHDDDEDYYEGDNHLHHDATGVSPQTPDGLMAVPLDSPTGGQFSGETSVEGRPGELDKQELTEAQIV